MSGMLLGLLAETSIHVGVGQVDGAIDLPVAREGGTEYPYAPGSGVKGALRDEALDQGHEDKARRWFGAAPVNGQDPAGGGGAGEVLVGDLRLLLLPVRSLNAGSYVWLTCPHLLERFGRDHERLGLGGRQSFDFKALASSDAAQPPKILWAGDGPIYLEERLFASAPLPNSLVAALKSVLPDAAAAARLETQLGVVSDSDFAWFARNALPVAAHNTLNATTKQSENLWYEESLPPDTVMTLVLLDRKNNSASAEVFEALFGATGRPYLRVGGNETTGQGWFKVGAIRGNDRT